MYSTKLHQRQGQWGRVGVHSNTHHTRSRNTSTQDKKQRRGTYALTALDTGIDCCKVDSSWLSRSQSCSIFLSCESIAPATSIHEQRKYAEQQLEQQRERRTCYHPARISGCASRSSKRDGGATTKGFRIQLVLANTHQDFVAMRQQ